MAQARFLTISLEARKVFLNSVLNPVKVYEKDGYKIFGIERDTQNTLNYNNLRYNIASHMNPSIQACPGFVQIIGDSQPFTSSGTKIAKLAVDHFVNKQYPQSIVMFGFTGKRNEHANIDANYALTSLMVDDKINANRVLANTVDFHTPLAIEKWPNVFVSDKIMYFTFVYTNTKEPQASFGDDTLLTDQLTDTAAICLEGGIQSLLQLINLLHNNVRVTGVSGLRDLSDIKNSRYFDPDSNKPYLSAVHFLEFIKNKVAKVAAPKDISDSDVKGWIDEYLCAFALSNKNAKDGATKEKLWNEAKKKLYDFKIWEKLDLFVVKTGNELQQSCDAQESKEQENSAIARYSMVRR